VAARAEIAHLDKIEAKLAATKDNYRAEQTRIPVSMERQAATATGVAQQGRCRFLHERIHPARAFAVASTGIASTEHGICSRRSTDYW